MRNSDEIKQEIEYFVLK